MPDRMTVAAPVPELCPMSRTGLRLVSVKYPVSSWMALASTRPIRTAPSASQRGLPAWCRMAGSVMPLNWLNLAGRYVNDAMATPTAEITAETKKPRLMAVMPLRSPLRGRTTKIPMTAVITPIAGTISGKTRPSSPKATLPRISAATSMTEYDSNRSAAMPAQSPTLSPTLSAMVAAFRGSSSGMPCSTFPTRSAPTSAALV